MEEKRLPELYPGWKTVRKIGSGSFGTVYEIERDLFGKVEKAALKFISIPQNDGDVEEMYSNGYDDASITAHFESYLANIVREYSLMVEMKGHTNVVYCDDIRYAPREDGIGWDITIKMELLTPLIKALGPDFGEEQVIRLGKDLCRALALCKDRDIVHRDIKPQNIFVSKTGDYKLGDFGIAKTVEQTTGGTKIGTYSYMAPEVYHNKPYGSSADIYSLGLVMYWLLNERRLPFLSLPPKSPSYEETENARHRRFMGEEFPAPKNGSEELNQIVLKACAFDPKDRFASAQEMLDALNSLEHVPEKLTTTREKLAVLVRADSEDDRTVGPFFTLKLEPQHECKLAPNPEWNTEPKSAPDLETKHRKIGYKNENGWECACGREHASYVSTCVCGISKNELNFRIKEIEPKAQSPKNEVSDHYDGINVAPAKTHVFTRILYSLFAVAILCIFVFVILRFTDHEHTWTPATYDAPMTCTTCGATSGDPKSRYNDRLVEQIPSDQFGKIWVRTYHMSTYDNPDPVYRVGSMPAKKDYPDAHYNTSIPGYVCGSVKDNKGNVYLSGISIDAKGVKEYYMEFTLNGQYSKFTGTCACPAEECAINPGTYDDEKMYEKYFEVYGDGVYIGTSPVMTHDALPQVFEFDVTGVNTLTIKYPASPGPNEIATIYDGVLE